VLDKEVEETVDFFETEPMHDFADVVLIRVHSFRQYQKQNEV
jgi:hypothetical protein